MVPRTTSLVEPIQCWKRALREADQIAGAEWGRLVAATMPYFFLIMNFLRTQGDGKYDAAMLRWWALRTSSLRKRCAAPFSTAWA